MAREYFKVIPAVYLVLRRDGFVLLLKRANTGYMDGYYSLPAGHVDGNEPAIQAAVREAKEELNLDLDVANLRLAHTMHRQVDADDRAGLERIDMFFEVVRWEGEPQNAEPHKSDELRWAELADLPENMVPEVRQSLTMITNSEPYSDFNF
jgi:8-oxo-dGTP diphosphatase